MRARRGLASPMRRPHAKADRTTDRGVAKRPALRLGSRGPPPMLSTAASPLHVSRSDDGRVVRLMLSGELDMSTSTSLELELSTVEARHPDMLVLDLSDLRFMGVSGLRSILDAARRARRDGRQLVGTTPVPHILRLFELPAIDQSVELLRAPLPLVTGGMSDPPLATA